ncbi:hypothetical protein Agub_g14407 [Astrephomene gubernaculifera]|uniref:Uncharacterized protein n=1 Tax=Astrephomene gubernaculifera TaxID=47775 RepID=A0AAD3HT56_9CHLO|nr:hypothetical protein Agub_g14407 [Astrephomene gubernaculifera]
MTWCTSPPQPLLLASRRSPSSRSVAAPTTLCTPTRRASSRRQSRPTTASNRSTTIESVARASACSSRTGAVSLQTRTFRTRRLARSQDFSSLPTVWGWRLSGELSMPPARWHAGWRPCAGLGCFTSFGANWAAPQQLSPRSPLPPSTTGSATAAYIAPPCRLLVWGERRLGFGDSLVCSSSGHMHSRIPTVMATLPPTGGDGFGAAFPSDSTQVQWHDHPSSGDVGQLLTNAATGQPQPTSSQNPLLSSDPGAAILTAAVDLSRWDRAVFDARFSDLVAILPDLPRVLPSLPPAHLLAAMSDPRTIADKVVALKAVLPSVNVGMLLLSYPPALDPLYGVDKLMAGVTHADRVLGGRAVVAEVLQWYPPLIDPAVLDTSVAELRRLVPQLARRCLPSAGGGHGSRGGSMGAAVGGGDARQLVHLLGIVMQTEGGSARAGEQSGGNGSGTVWWGCS